VTAATAALGAGDCEQIGDGVLRQPVNTVSSAAFVLAGIWLLTRTLHTPPGWRRRLMAFALAVILAGLGSIAFHGVSVRGARALHDLGTAAVPLVLIAQRTDDLTRLSRLPRTTWPLTLTALLLTGAAVRAVSPAATGAVQALAVVAAGVLEGRFRLRGKPATGPALDATPRRRYLTAAAALSVGLVAYAAGRTGSPVCDPTSLWQGHGLWHLLAAGAATAFGYGAYDIAPARKSPAHHGR